MKRLPCGPETRGTVNAGCVFAVSAKYKIKKIPVKAASEYPSHQSLQNIVIGAEAFDRQEEVLSAFDTKKLYEKGIMPVFVVVENNNDFAIRISGKDIYLNDAGHNYPSLPYTRVLLSIAKKKKSTYSTHENILLGQLKNKKMVADFERKDLGERLIPPYGSDSGVVFFEWLQLQADTRIYISNITNLSSQESLMFFEFSLQ